MALAFEIWGEYYWGQLAEWNGQCMGILAVGGICKSSNSKNMVVVSGPC